MEKIFGQFGEIEIVDYDPKYRAAFMDLNREWIERYFVMEEMDEYVLGNPEASILDGGGRILFAVKEGEAIGTVALKPVSDGVMELSKMGVSAQHRGHGAGRKLCKSAIALAKELGLQKLILLTNHQLATAIHIYEQLGFQRVPVGNVEYERADVKMELALR